MSPGNPMETTALISTEPHTIAALALIAERTRDYLVHAKARNTLRAYRSDWTDGLHGPR